MLDAVRHGHEDCLEGVRGLSQFEALGFIYGVSKPALPL